MRIFLSHSHEDFILAEALQKLIHDFFPNKITVEYSSDQSQGGGIPPGDAWLPWIMNHIKKARKTCVLLTPNSTFKPWVLWESGAAAGLAISIKPSRQIVPIIFGIPDKDVPNPFTPAQSIRGDTMRRGGIRRLLQQLNQELHSPFKKTR